MHFNAIQKTTIQYPRVYYKKIRENTIQIRFILEWHQPREALRSFNASLSNLSITLTLHHINTILLMETFYGNHATRTPTPLHHHHKHPLHHKQKLSEDRVCLDSCRPDFLPRIYAGLS